MNGIPLLPLPVSSLCKSQVAVLSGKGGCSLNGSEEAGTCLYFENLRMERILLGGVGWGGGAVQGCGRGKQTQQVPFFPVSLAGGVSAWSG